MLLAALSLIHGAAQEYVRMPQALKSGDTIAIISPSSTPTREVVERGCAVLRGWGYVPVVGKHVFSSYHGFAGTAEERAADLLWALRDSTIKAIMCSRGGYGAVHLLEYLDLKQLARDPKWIIGFSDISALHAAWHHAGVVSIHSPMAKHLTLYDRNDEINLINYNILTQGEFPTYNVAPHPYNRSGAATATILGGNLAVLMSLLATPFNIIKPGTILFIEDVAEQVYQVQRLLYHLRLAGILPQLAGLIVGQFTKHRGDDTTAMYDMIHDMVAPYHYPVAFNFPIGHIPRNVPIIEGSTATLNVENDGTTLSMRL